jgi:hypothetical protein
MSLAADEYQGLRKPRHRGLVDQRFFHAMLFSKWRVFRRIGPPVSSSTGESHRYCNAPIILQLLQGLATRPRAAKSPP